MTTVYVVTRGCYSDYGIERIFSTRELAEQYVAAFATATRSADGYRIEEWTLDDMPVEIREGMSPFSVGIMPNGDVWKTEKMPREAGGGVCAEVRPYSHDAPRGKLWTECWARDEAHAIKIATERLQEWRVKSGWVAR